MGNEENETPTKPPKPSSTQEQPPPSSPATVFHDWASFQAYYSSAGTPPIPPPGYFHSPVASSPQAHPYMWGQHMLPPYGTPPPHYVTMYPHGGLYAHPSAPPGSHPYNPYAIVPPNGTAEASIAATSGRESESKSGEGKKKNPLKRSKGSLGSLSMLTGKDNNETSKAASGGSNGGGFSQSGESGGEGSSEGSDANSHNDSQQSEKGSADAGGGAQNGGTTCSVSSGVSQTFPTQAMSMVMPVPPSSVSSPTTNLNIGMDYWGGGGHTPLPPVATSGRAKLPTVQPPGAIVSSNLVGPRGDGIPPELWIQDERELKRQRRKQSNRESARRSRLRKQAEYDELAQRVELLKDENGSLRDELARVREECDKLKSENASLTEKLEKHVVGQVEESRGDKVNGDRPVTANIESTESR